MPEAVPANYLARDVCPHQRRTNELFHHHVEHQGLNTVQFERREEQIIVIAVQERASSFRQDITHRFVQWDRLVACLLPCVPEMISHARTSDGNLHREEIGVALFEREEFGPAKAGYPAPFGLGKPDAHT